MWLIVLRVVVSAALIIWLVRSVDLKLILLTIEHVSIPWLFAVMGLIITSVWLSAWKWGVLLKAQQVVIPMRKLFSLYSIGLFFNNFLPSSIGGDGARIVMAGNITGNSAAVASSVVVERILATMTLALLGLVGVMFTYSPSTMAIVLLLALLLVSIALAAICLSGWVPGWVQRRESRWSAWWVRFSQSAGALRSQRRALLTNVALSLAFQVNVTLVVMAVMACFHLQVIGFFDMLYVTSTASVMAMVPIGLNGYGLREGAFIALLAPFGYSTSDAFTVSIMFVLLVTVYSLWGGLQWLSYRSGELQAKIVSRLSVPLILVGLALIPAVREWCLSLMQLFGTVDPAAVADYIRSFGVWAVAVSFLLMVIQSVAAPLPSFLITFANAAIFGWLWGAALSWASAMAGAALCFVIARWYGRDVVVKLIGKSSLNTVDDFFAKSGAHAIVLARLLPFMPFDLVSYAAGLTAVRFRVFLLATGIGQLPATLIYSYAGEMLVGSARQFVFGLLIVFSLVAIVAMLRNLRKQA